jgi:uroporphyrinogen decarboxylase
MNASPETIPTSVTQQAPEHLFIRAALGFPIERPPVWIMRQAGRILPQYRQLRANFPDFKAFVKTPEAATEATIQPVEELGVDAAIIFSDILVIPEAMGLDYEMEEKKGPRFPKTIENEADITRLASGKNAAERLDYVYQALTLTKKALSGRVPLIGFAGAPWTIFAYMLEGGGSKTFSKARRFLYTEPTQTRSGADLIQLFDSWAGELTPSQYRVFALPYLRQICDALPDTPKTVFAKGAWFALEDISTLSCQVIGLDWNTSAAFAKQETKGRKVLQGNLDPCALYGAPKSIENDTLTMLRSFGGHHIANLGHGVYPDTPLDGVRIFVDTVKGFRY